MPSLKKVDLPSEIDGDVVYFVTAIFCDGCIESPYHVSFFGDNNFCRVISLLGRKIFGYPGTIRTVTMSGLSKVLFSRKTLVTWLVENFGVSGSRIWKIPKEFLIPQFKTAVLRAIFDTEGSPSFYKPKKKRMWSRRILLTLSNYEVIQHVATVLSSLGIGHRITHYPKRHSWKITISGRQNLYKFKNTIGFSSWAYVRRGKFKGIRKKDYLDYILNSYCANTCTRELRKRAYLKHLNR